MGREVWGRSGKSWERESQYGKNIVYEILKELIKYHLVINKRINSELSNSITNKRINSALTHIFFVSIFAGLSALKQCLIPCSTLATNS